MERIMEKYKIMWRREREKGEREKSVCALVPDPPLCQVPLHELSHYYQHQSA